MGEVFVVNARLAWCTMGGVPVGFYDLMLDGSLCDYCGQIDQCL